MRQNYGEAGKWFRKAADQEHASAQYNLAFIYAKGHGVRQDWGEAVKWFRKAADHGDAKAQYILGVMHENGEGMPQDYVQAQKWFNLAAANFPASDTESREKAVRDRDQISAKMTPAQIAEAQRLAREWKPK